MIDRNTQWRRSELLQQANEQAAKGDEDDRQRGLRHNRRLPEPTTIADQAR